MKKLTLFERSALRSVGACLSPGGRHAALVVLMYHRALPEPDPMLWDEPDAERFAAQMDIVRSLFRVHDLAEAVEKLSAGRLPSRSVAITFDDGYANNLDVAAPILAERGLTATFFVATGHRDGSAMWNDIVIEALRRAPAGLDLSEFGLEEPVTADPAARRAAADRLLRRLKYRNLDERSAMAQAIARRSGTVPPVNMMMTDGDLQRLASMGMAIGAHCVNHPILTRLTEASARLEIIESKRQLEQLLRAPVRTFAYPNGRPVDDYSAAHVAMVREAGFSVAVSTAWGAATRRCDPWQMPRVAPWDRSPVRFALRLLRAFTQRRPARV